MKGYRDGAEQAAREQKREVFQLREPGAAW